MSVSSTTVTDMDTSIDMDVTDKAIYILECPFCAHKFVFPLVYRTHLIAHVVYHSRGNRYKCGRCRQKDRDVTKIAIHIESRHSKYTRHRTTSPYTREIEAENLAHKESLIMQLSNSDDPDCYPSLPY